MYEHSATKFRDRSEPLSEIHEGDNLSIKPKISINAIVLLNAVKKHADELFKKMVLEGVDADSANIEKGSMITADVWDFAGQHVYYAAHPVFLSPRAVYIVVHNLNKPLNARAQPCARQGILEVTLENPNNETNLENLLSWLVTVHNMRPTGEEMVKRSNRLPYLRPPVFIVGTHADKPYEDRKDVSSKILREISSKEYVKHVIRPFFFIDNNQGDQSFTRNPQAGKSGVWVQHNVCLSTSYSWHHFLPIWIFICFCCSHFFCMYFLYFLLLIFLSTRIAYVNTIANVFVNQIIFNY